MDDVSSNPTRSWNEGPHKTSNEELKHPTERDIVSHTGYSYAQGNIQCSKPLNKTRKPRHPLTLREGAKWLQTPRTPHAPPASQSRILQPEQGRWRYIVTPIRHYLSHDSLHSANALADDDHPSSPAKRSLPLLLVDMNAPINRRLAVRVGWWDVRRLAADGCFLVVKWQKRFEIVST